MAYLILFVALLVEYSVLLVALLQALGEQFQVYSTESVVSLVECSMVLKTQLVECSAHLAVSLLMLIMQ